MQLKDKVALITGGGSGLGEATAHGFKAAGAKVAVLDLPSSPGAQVAEALGADGLFVSADVTATEEVARAVRLTLERFGAIHIAVNCAGIARPQRTLTRNGPHSLELFNTVIQVNLVGTFNVIRLVAAEMARNEPNDDGERGVIVNTASISAFEGRVGQAAYAASKAGVVGMTVPISRDLARDGIRVCTIAPGIFETPMNAEIDERGRESLRLQQTFPQRFGRPAEFAALARQIVENPMFNGVTIRLDAGLIMPPRY
jgi:3-hydroxyacyl-CoA dehydrogenase / 3-hydroxy-2-methylbutyryl-CoA dehydrogenase